MPGPREFGEGAGAKGDGALSSSQTPGTANRHRMAEMMLMDAGQPDLLQNWAASCPSTACLAEERERDGCKVGFDCLCVRGRVFMDD